MSRIRSKNTAIELTVRRQLHALGFRYRLGGASLPGRPDLVLPKYRTAIFVHGCFWHGHDCKLFRLPKTRSEFWRQKIETNRARDSAAAAKLIQLGWRPLYIWECQLRGRKTPDLEAFFLQVDREIREPASKLKT